MFPTGRLVRLTATTAGGRTVLRRIIRPGRGPGNRLPDVPPGGSKFAAIEYHLSREGGRLARITPHADYNRTALPGRNAR